MKLLKCCNKQGCPELVESGYCEAHKKEKFSYDKYRGTPTERGYNSRWAKYSKLFLKKHPLCMCAECAKLMVPLPSQVTDHIIPHKGDPIKFWKKENHQALNKRCHDIKTLDEGSFGR